MAFDMIIRNEFFKRYLLSMAIDQLTDEYTKNGYEVKAQYPLFGDIMVDLYAVKNGERVAIEFVEDNTSKELIKRIKQLATVEAISLKFINISQIKIEQ